MNGKVNDYEKLVSSIQKDVTVLEIDLYNQTGCYGLYRNGKIYIEKTLSTRQKKNTSRGIRALSNIRWHYFKSKLYRKSEARVESSQCGLRAISYIRRFNSLL